MRWTSLNGSVNKPREAWNFSLTSVRTLECSRWQRLCKRDTGMMRIKTATKTTSPSNNGDGRSSTHTKSNNLSDFVSVNTKNHRILVSPDAGQPHVRKLTGLGINPFYRELFSSASLPGQGWAASNRRNALLKGVFITMNTPFSCRLSRKLLNLLKITQF